MNGTVDICQRCGVAVYLCPMCSFDERGGVFSDRGRAVHHHEGKPTDATIECTRNGGPHVGAPS